MILRDMEHQMYCSVCGQYHEVDTVPISCQTGDGE